MSTISSTSIHKFVGRKEQINLVEERIGIIQYGGSVFQAVVNFHGVVGIGKTVLLRELEERVSDKRLPYAFVDFTDPQDQVALREIATNLTGDHNGPAVLFLDTLEKADPELLDWMEDEVISPLIRTDRALVIAASRAPHRWKRFEVRRRAHPARLDPFDERTTRKQLPKRYSALAAEVMRLTYGHPFGNVQVFQSILKIEQEIGRPFKCTDFDEYRARLVQELVDQLIEQIVMQDVPSDIRHAYRVVALARHFDVNVLRRLLTRFVQDPFADKSAAYFLGVVGAMVKTTLVEWRSDRRGYALDDTIRGMLALNVKLTNQKLYQEINQDLIGLYDEWIGRVPENRSGFIIERLYHEVRLQNARGASTEDIADRLCRLIKDYLKYYPMPEGGETPHGRTVLKEELSRDTDLMEFSARLISVIEAANGDSPQSETTSNKPGGQG